MTGTYLVDEEGTAISAANPLDVSASFTFTGSDIEIGAVELKNGTDDTRATIGAGAAITEANNTLAVKDPSLGLKADTAATTDTGTFSLIALFKKGLQGLTTIIARIPALGAALTASSIPVTMASDQANINVVLALSAPVGTHGNAWNNVAVAINGVSNSIDLQYVVFTNLFGNTSGASTITLQYSQDNINFYDTNVTVAANGNFSSNVNLGARYVRLKSSAAVTITAIIAGKGY